MNAEYADAMPARLGCVRSVEMPYIVNSFRSSDNLAIPLIRTHVISKNEIIGSDGAVTRYYTQEVVDHEGIRSPHDAAYYRRILTESTDWMAMRREYDRLPESVKRLERVKSFLGISRYQAVFVQEDLREQFEAYSR